MKPTGKHKLTVGVRASAAGCSSLCVSIKQEVALEPLRPPAQKEPREMAGLVWFSPAAFLLQQYKTAICGLPIKQVHRANSNKQPKGTEGN